MSAGCAPAAHVGCGGERGPGESKMAQREAYRKAWRDLVALREEKGRALDLLSYPEKPCSSEPSAAAAGPVLGRTSRGESEVGMRFPRGERRRNRPAPDQAAGFGRALGPVVAEGRPDRFTGCPARALKTCGPAQAWVVQPDGSGLRQGTPPGGGA